MTPAAIPRPPSPAGAATRVAAVNRRESALRKNPLFQLLKVPLSTAASLPAVVTYAALHPAPAAAEAALLGAGVLLAACGAGALNQLLETDVDRRMVRTQGRPLPQNTYSRRQGMLLALLFSVSGILILALRFPPAVPLLTATTLILYAFVYTPLKRRTHWCTEIGAVPGALPVLIGAAAAGGLTSPLGLSLFLVLFLWQMPHFHPIAWRHREDYGRAGLRMRVLSDGSGDQAVRHVLVYSALLVGASLLPFVLGHAGPVYLGTAMILGAVQLRNALAFREPHTRDRAARRLFRFSLIYLAVLLTVLLLDLRP